MFGYASLAAGESRARVFHLRGYRRAWNVAMDNRLELPGYKVYIDRDTGERPEVFVTFLNLVADPQGTINGVLLPVQEGAVREFDRRERNYRRVDVTAQVVEPVAGTVWAYIGSAAARQRYRRGSEQGRAVIDAGYARAVEVAFRGLGEEAWREFTDSTEPPPCPQRVLVRLDLP